MDFRMFLPRASGQDVTNPIFLESQLMQYLGAHSTGLGAPNQIDSVFHCRFFSPDVLAQDAIDQKQNRTGPQIHGSVCLTPSLFLNVWVQDVANLLSLMVRKLYSCLRRHTMTRQERSQPRAPCVQGQDEISLTRLIILLVVKETLDEYALVPSAPNLKFPVLAIRPRPCTCRAWNLAPNLMIVK